MASHPWLHNQRQMTWRESGTRERVPHPSTTQHAAARPSGADAPCVSRHLSRGDTRNTAVWYVHRVVERLRFVVWTTREESFAVISRCSFGTSCAPDMVPDAL